MPIQLLTVLPPDLTIISQSEPTSTPDNHPSSSSPLVCHHQPNTILDISPPMLVTSTNTTIAASLKGDVYIAQNKIYFSSSTQILSIDYLNIIVHAISRSGDRIIQTPHIYCQLDENVSSCVIDSNGNTLSTSSTATGGGGDEEETKLEDHEITFELRIVPEDSNSLDTLFQTMSQCASLHPDPNCDREDQDMPDFSDPDAGWVFASDQQNDAGPERRHTGGNRFAPYNLPNTHSAREEEGMMMRAVMQHVQDTFDVPSGYVEEMIASTTGAGTGATNGANVEGQFEDVEGDMQR